MAKLYINGNSYPVVGNEESYSVMNLPSLEKFEFRDKSSLSLQKNYEYNWNLEVLINGTWHKRPYPKTGNSISYRLDPVALTRKKVKLTVTKGEDYAELPLYPKQAEKPEIQKVELLDSNRKPIEKGKILSCGDILIVQAQCTGLYGKTLIFNLYKYDKEGPSQDSHSLHINSSKVKIDKNGKAEVSFKLLNQYIARAINKIGSDTISKVKNHEYYVVANVDAAKAPQHSPNVNVKNPIYNFQNLIEKSYQFLVNPLSIIPTAKPENKTPAQITNSEPASNCEEKYCIKKGDKSELIREINIRLAGFGGNVPTDEFTDRTEKMIKQFQRDYMKVTETGKICGNVLKAIDEFSSKYNIEFDEIKCKCGKCAGFGNGKFSEQKQNSNIAESARKYEYPGIHRSLVWALRALNFYMNKTNLGYSLNRISSGYRCWVDNDKNGRRTTNHMGKALDLHFNKNGIRTQQINDMEIIRDKIIIPYMGGQLRWGNANKFSIEPTRKAHNKEFIATTWIHYDVRQFELRYLKDKYFSSSLSSLNGKTIVNLAKESGYTNTCNCLGTTNTKKKEEKDEVCYDCDLKFRKVAPIILENEGGYINDPDDSGGATNKGITIGTWRAYAKEDLGVEPTLENLKKITNEEATKIYRKRYWEPKGFCKINDDKVGLMIYDWTITSGGAGKEIQKLLVNEFEQSIVIDGDIGTNTINAINNVQDQEKLLNRVAEIRKQYYRNLAYDEKGKPTKNIKFLEGWLNRVNKCLNYNL